MVVRGSGGQSRDQQLRSELSVLGAKQQSFPSAPTISISSRTGHLQPFFVARLLREKQQWTKPNFIFASHLLAVDAGINLLIVQIHVILEGLH